MGIFDIFRQRFRSRSDSERPENSSSKGSPPEALDDPEKALAQVRAILRKASLAQVGGFRPPEDPCVSWFGRGVGKRGEGLPLYDEATLFPLLQINVSELPYVPPQLEGITLLVLFLDRFDYPFDEPHGSGWLIREYSSLEGLVPLPEAEVPLKPFPIRWNLIEDDAPGWEDAGEAFIDQGPFLRSEGLSESFFEDFNRYPGTKVGGFPDEIQHGVGLENFVFQVGSEVKAEWMWADNGIGYFFRDPNGEWSWSCQFY